MSISMNQSLKGIRVIETGTTRAVKVAGMILRDCGADVVRIDYGDIGRKTSAVTDRSKNFIYLSDINNDNQVNDLLQRTDILIDDGSGCVFTDIIKKNPHVAEHLIYCSLPSSLSDNNSSMFWNEDAISAAAGLFETPTGLGLPRSFPLPIASMATAFHAVNAIAMALIGRQRNGKGYSLNIPVEKTALSIQILVAMIRSKPPLQWEPFRWLASPFLGVWKTADGFIYIHTGMPRHLRNFMFLLESAGFKQEKGDIKRLLHKNTRRDPVVMSGVREAFGISKVLRSLFLKKPAEYWEQVLSDAGLCCAKVRTFDEWKTHPQVVESEEIISFPNTNGNLKIPGKIIDSPSGSGVALEQGERVTPELILQLWTKKSYVRNGKPGSALPLEGVRVLDLSRVIAGPFTGRLLAEYGADVVHMTLRGSILSWEQPFHVTFNGGKESVAIDCSRPGGLQLFREAIEKFKPDIIVHNYLDEAAVKLGVDYESMKKINSEIVYIGIKGYNSTGPWRKRPGFEQCIQATSGVLNTYSSGVVPQILPMPFIDLSTGLISSFATALCCYQLNNGNGGNCISANLSTPAIYLQMDSLNESNDKPISKSVNGFYQSKDGLFYMSIKRGENLQLSKIPEFKDAMENGVDVHELKKCIRKKRYSFWQKRVSEFSIGEFVQIVPRIPFRKILEKELVKKEGMFSYKEHEGLGKILVGNTPVHMDPRGINDISTAEPIGKSTSQFLGKTSTDAEYVKNPLEIKRTSFKNIMWFLRQCKWVIVTLQRESGLRK